MSEPNKDVEIGSWVRFYQGGTLVIGVVQYLEKDYLGFWKAKTDIGEVDTRQILEVR